MDNMKTDTDVHVHVVAYFELTSIRRRIVFTRHCALTHDVIYCLGFFKQMAWLGLRLGKQADSTSLSFSAHNGIRPQTVYISRLAGRLCNDICLH